MQVVGSVLTCMEISLSPVEPVVNQESGGGGGGGVLSGHRSKHTTVKKDAYFRKREGGRQTNREKTYGHKSKTHKG